MSNADKLADGFHDAIPTGINGWLLLLVIKLWFGAVLRVFVGIAELPHLLGIFNLVYGLAGGYAGFLLTTRNPRGVKAAKIFLLADAAYYLLVFGDALLGGEASRAVREGGFCVASVLYFLYLGASKRVKATYSPTSVVTESAVAGGT